MTREMTPRLWILGTVSAFALIVALIIGLSTILVGSPSVALAYVNGQRIIVSPSTKNLGLVHAGELQQVTFTVRNLSRIPVTITGARTSCTCVRTGRYPIRLRPHEVTRVAFSVKARREAASISESVTLYTDLTQQPEIFLGIRGVIRPEGDPH